jgi:Zn-finger nucleic acid-binding protein
MNCPVCKNAMIERDFGGVIVHVCENGCKGIWFDWFGLSKLDKTNEGVGQALQDALHYPRVADANRGQITCPKCNELMHRHEYKYDKEINIDECYDCGGIFLDSGELNEIRDHHMSEPEEDAYFQKLVNNVPGYQQSLQDEDKAKLREDALRHFTRFLRISYYVTGK